MASLRERFESFLKTLDGFESIDTLLKAADPHGRKRADYLAYNRHIVIEQKVLQSNPTAKPQKFVDKLAHERGFMFFGNLSSEQIFAKQPDPEKLQRRMILDLARVINDDVADADKQTAQTRQLFNIPDAMGVLIFLNEDAKLLRPDIVHFALAHAFQKKINSGLLRYPANDGVIVISEAHSLVLPPFERAFPILSYLSPQRRQVAFFTQFSNTLMEQWAAFNGVPLVRR